MSEICHRIFERGEVRKLPNGATYYQGYGFIRQRKREWMTDGKLMQTFPFEAVYRCGKDRWKKESQDRKTCERWIRDMKMNYKYKIEGTMYTKEYLKVVKSLKEQVLESLRNTNYMLAKPYDGYSAYEDRKYGQELVYFLGVTGGVFYCRTQEGEEKEIDLNLYADMLFDEFDFISILSFTDYITSFK